MSETDKTKRLALQYHAEGRPGKLTILPTKPCMTAHDLTLAYSPGVAHPCLEIAKNPEDAYTYTTKGNLVAVISNGSAVLGLGNIGPEASKPVMEGKGILFKRFADIDVFDIEINAQTVEEMVQSVASMAPTFGGINLEDIKAPECFEVEKKLQDMLDIPVFHDDQHGTAIIASAGFINALEIAGKRIEDVRVVFSGAGAASMACADLFFKLGVRPENLLMCDSKGVIYKGRKEGMNPYKEKYAVQTDRKTLQDAMRGADAFIGCSAKGVVSKSMVASMAKTPIIFAMANPEPEIMPEEVAEVRDDAIMATGRTDYPNQVNNVLGFPFIFRGALDVRAKKINEEMKLAAVHALAKLAKEEVPEDVKMAYGDQDFSFGPKYVIPKPFDKRVLTRVCPAVAKAAMESGVARKPLEDLNLYRVELERRLGSPSASFMRGISSRLDRKNKSKLVFAEGTSERVLKAISTLVDEGTIEPVLLGNKDEVRSKMKDLRLDHLKDCEVIDPEADDRYNEYANAFHHMRKRKGVTLATAKDRMRVANYFGCMMVRQGHADGMITGATQNYPDCVNPVMEVLRSKSQRKTNGIIILVMEHKLLFLTDCTMQISPTAQELSDSAISTVELYKTLIRKNPSIAFLSYSNFGSNRTSSSASVSKAVELTKERLPDINVEGEMQADVAVNQALRDKMFSFHELQNDPDILVFPELNSANISYKLLAQLGGAIPLGPILYPMDYPVNIVQRTSTVEEIVNMSHLTALIATEHQVKEH